MVEYHRNLPHWFPEGQSIFVTWRLYGSLPVSALERLQQQAKYSAIEKFRHAEAALDRADSGPVWLKDARIADHLVATLQKGQDLRHYNLHAFAVMANHVHALLTPSIEVRRIMNAIKGVTSREANTILKRTGKPFWQDESFDRWIRDEKQFEDTRNYIEQNPVKAGLVGKPEDWQWSSAYHINSRIG